MYVLSQLNIDYSIKKINLLKYTFLINWLSNLIAVGMIYRVSTGHYEAMFSSLNIHHKEAMLALK